MPAILHMGMVGTCAHAPGALTVVTADFKVRVKGMPVLTRSDLVTVSGCTNPSGNLCTSVRWLTASNRIFASGQPVVLASSVGDGVTAIPPSGGPVVILASQVAVQGRS